MKKNSLLLLLLFPLYLFISCVEEGDTENPGIDLTIEGAFPQNCDTLYFGEPFTFKVLFTDNAELGSYNIDIHNNFDHHSHTTEVTECSLGEVKDPVIPITFIQDYSIPDGLQEYETSLTMTLEEGDFNGEYDEGDYHLFIKLSDKEGWTAQAGLSIKIMHRQTGS